MRAIRWGGTTVLGALAFVLLGCAHLWAPKAPSLIFGPPTVQGERGEMVVSVADLPKGVGALGVTLGGITYPEAKMADIKVEGASGYVVLAQEFASGQGGFIISTISSQGISSGPIAVITFRVLDDITPGEIAFDETKIALIDVDNAPVDFDLSQPIYYAR